MEKQKKVISSKKKAKRLLATAMAFAMTGSVISTGIMPVKEKVIAAAAGITESRICGAAQCSRMLCPGGQISGKPGLPEGTLWNYL